MFSIARRVDDSSVTKFETAHLSIDFITHFLNRTLHCKPIRQVATSVIDVVVAHYFIRFNMKCS